MRVEHIVLALVAVCALAMVGHQVWSEYQTQGKQQSRAVRVEGGTLVEATGKPEPPKARTEKATPRANPNDDEFNTPAVEENATASTPASQPEPLADDSPPASAPQPVQIPQTPPAVDDAMAHEAVAKNEPATTTTADPPDASGKTDPLPPPVESSPPERAPDPPKVDAVTAPKTDPVVAPKTEPASPPAPSVTADREKPRESTPVEKEPAPEAERPKARTTGGLLVRVVDFETRAPIGGCPVRVRATKASGETGEFDERREATGANGELRMPTLGLGAYDVSLNAKDFLPDQSRVDVVAGLTPAEVTLYAARGAAVTGTVVDATGAPVGGAKVDLLASPTSALARPLSCETQADGGFQLAGIRVVRDATYSIRVRHPRFASEAGATAELVAGERCALGRVAFPAERPKVASAPPTTPASATPNADSSGAGSRRPASEPTREENVLRGRVRDAAGRWLEQAKAMVGSTSVSTGADGFFEMRLASADPVDLRVRWFAPGEPSAPFEKTLRVAPDGKVRTIDLVRVGVVFVLENSGADAVRGPLVLAGRGRTQKVDVKYPALGSLIGVPMELEPGAWEFELRADGFETEIVRVDLPASVKTSEYRVAVALRKKR